MEVERDDALVLAMIEAAVMAGGYASLARQDPSCAGGMLKMAAKFSAQVGAYADAVCEDAASRFIELADEGEEGASTQAAPLPYCRRDDRR